MKTTMVTGGTSFLGSHLCEELLARGHQVLCVDGGFNGQKRNVTHLLGNPRFQCVPHDFALGAQIGVEEIYNLPDSAIQEVRVIRPREGQAPSVKVARLSGAYGPRMSEQEGGALGPFIDQALRGESIRLRPEMETALPFCFVDDLAAGLIRLMECPAPCPGPGPLELAGTETISALDLAQIIVRMCGSKSQIVIEPGGPQKPGAHLPDVTPARTILGWEPRVSLETGLQRTIDHFRWVSSNSPWVAS